MSYSRQDRFFAELAAIKLGEAGVTIWRDQNQLRPGSEWRAGIERGIKESIAIIVALSQRSADSPYVMFEWAYGLGKGKTVVPLKLENCKVHPRLEPIQHLDFSSESALPWDLLAERIREIEEEATSQEDLQVTSSASSSEKQDPTVRAILVYLEQRGYQMMTYDRVRRRINPDMIDDDLDKFVEKHSDVFRKAILKDKKPGLAKLVP